MRTGVTEIIMKVWKEGNLPKNWKMSVIVPLHKEGDKEKTDNYREISLLCTAYKIYAEIMRGRLEKEVERIKLLPESQCGFRKGRGTIDNIFVMSHLIQREGLTKDKKIFAVFVDLKATFDNVERKLVWKIMDKNGIEKELVRRLEEKYEETTSVVRTEESMTALIQTRKGVKQECVLSPLFSIYVADTDKCMERRAISGIKLERERLWTLAYADDIIIVAKNREALLDMLDTFRKFLKEKKIALNTEKSKIMVFNKGGKEKKRKEAYLEDVKIYI